MSFMDELKAASMKKPELPSDISEKFIDEASNTLLVHIENELKYKVNSRSIQREGEYSFCYYVMRQVTFKLGDDYYIFPYPNFDYWGLKIRVKNSNDIKMIFDDILRKIEKEIPGGKIFCFTDNINLPVDSETIMYYVQKKVLERSNVRICISVKLKCDSDGRI